jgi:hypothetical protein
MRRHSHRHRHASRHLTLLHRVACATVFVIGLGVLVGLFMLTPTGRFMLACAAAIPALFALVWLSYFAGRGAAKVHNSFARHSGRTGLLRMMRGQHHAEPTP